MPNAEMLTLQTWTFKTTVWKTSDRDLALPEKGVLAKGLNFPICPQQLPVVDLITATESAKE